MHCIKFKIYTLFAVVLSLYRSIECNSDQYTNLYKILSHSNILVSINPSMYGLSPNMGTSLIYFSSCLEFTSSRLNQHRFKLHTLSSVLLLLFQKLACFFLSSYFMIKPTYHWPKLIICFLISNWSQMLP